MARTAAASDGASARLAGQGRAQPGDQLFAQAAHALIRDEDCILVDDRDAQKLLEAKERSALLNAALAALKPEDREIFLRRYYYNQTAGQIAEALHMNPSTVRSPAFCADGRR